ncbi:hypothetical protein Dimus_018290, partial [Dionaea muscipula]
AATRRRQRPSEGGDLSTSSSHHTSGEGGEGIPTVAKAATTEQSGGTLINFTVAAKAAMAYLGPNLDG